MKWYDQNFLSNPMPIQIDAIDRRILQELQQDGRLQNVELAARVGLSPSPCLRRVRQLEEAGVIERYAAQLDAAKLGMSFTAFVRVSLNAQGHDTIQQFIDAMKLLPQVVCCYIMAGECDALLRVVAEDMDAYRRFQGNHLSRANGVQSVKTDIPLQKIKLSTKLPF
jgi:Lrp/AsnC family transcriptional regulator, leucine-responsive regulatory protein